MGEQSKKLGVMSLAALVVSAMVGGGIFSLPQNMSQGAGAGAVLIAWIITGVGIFFLANTFRILVLYSGNGAPAEVREVKGGGDNVVKGRKIKFWVDREQVEVIEAEISAPARGLGEIGGLGGLGGL